MFACEQFPDFTQVWSVFLVLSGIVAAIYISYVGAVVALKRAGADLNFLVSHNFFLLLVRFAGRRWVWGSICILSATSVWSWLLVGVRYAVSLGSGEFDWCTTVFLLNGTAVCAAGVLTGSLLFFATANQCFHIPLGKFTSLTTSDVRKYYLHLNGNIKPKEMSYVYVRNAIKRVIRGRSDLVLVMDSWLLAEGTPPPAGSQALTDVYASITLWHKPDSGGLTRAALLVCRLVAIFVLSPKIYLKYRALQFAPMQPSVGMLLIMRIFKTVTIEWSYKKTPFFQLLMLVVLYPEDVTAANGCSGVVVIKV